MFSPWETKRLPACSSFRRSFSSAASALASPLLAKGAPLSMRRKGYPLPKARALAHHRSAGGKPAQPSIRFRWVIRRFIKAFGICVGRRPLFIATLDFFRRQSVGTAACRATVQPPIHGLPIVGFALLATDAAHLLTPCFFQPQVLLVPLLATALAPAMVPFMRDGFGFAADRTGVLAPTLGRFPQVLRIARLPAPHTTAVYKAVSQQFTDQPHVFSPRCRLSVAYPRPGAAQADPSDSESEGTAFSERLANPPARRR